MSRPLRVLLADDDPELLRLSDTVLAREAGETLTTTTAATGSEALATLDAEPVDCLVSDSMAGPDGGALVSAARRDHPSLPVVLFTGHDRPTAAADADVVVEKGAGFDALVSAVRTVTAADDRDPEWTVVGRHDWAADAELVATLVPALASHLDRPVDAMPELYGAVDGEALETVLCPRGDGGARGRVRVSFRYCGLDVRLTGEGVLSVREG